MRAAVRQATLTLEGAQGENLRRHATTISTSSAALHWQWVPLGFSLPSCLSRFQSLETSPEKVDFR